MKKYNFLYHILFWLGLYLLWIVMFRSYSVSLTRTITIEFCYLVFITADYYLAVYFIIPAFLQKRKYSWFVLASSLLIFFSALLRAFVAVQMNRHFFHSVNNIDFATLYFSSVLNIAIWVQIITIGKMILDRKQNQQRLDQLEKEKIKSELDFLKAQINPHAFFNSINTIYGYIDKSNQTARDLLLQFSELLRYQLYDCSGEKTELKKEILFIEKYITFQKLRKEENLDVQMEIRCVNEELQIAPLLLVVLIENAFKHVSNFSDKANFIRLDLYTKDKALYCHFSNSTEQRQSSTIENSGGIGLANLKRRLELSYSNKYKLTSKCSNDLYETNLIIDLR